jgi:hypothetical protein
MHLSASMNMLLTSSTYRVTGWPVIFQDHVIKRVDLSFTIPGKTTIL